MKTYTKRPISNLIHIMNAQCEVDYGQDISEQGLSLRKVKFHESGLKSCSNEKFPNYLPGCDKTIQYVITH